MTTTRLTKEQLIEYIKRRIAFARCGCRFSDSDRALDLAVLEIALASLEAEPVAWTSQRSLDVRDKITAFTCKESADDYAEKSAWGSIVPLYATPQATNAMLQGEKS